MKTRIKLLVMVFVIGMSACKKKDDLVENVNPAANTYSSLSDFYKRNGASKQTYMVNATTGGIFTSPKGTKVTIPANAFLTQSGSAATGMVTIEFKDIYSKSDMLLSNIPSMTYLGSPLKSAGEFFIKAVSGTNLLTLNTGKKITVEQPAIGGVTDAAMIPFIAAAPDSVNNFVGWSPSPLDSLSIYESNYIFSLYSFSSTIDSGTWCNSDNGSFFSSYSQTTLTMHTVDDMTLYSTDVFLVFSGINSMVHVYQDGLGSFPYIYAPEGLNCTMVAIASKEGKLYSSFIPVSITSGLTVNFTLSETTDVDFKTQLNALN